MPNITGFLFAIIRLMDKKIVLVPMLAMAETSGPSSRMKLLKEGLTAEGFNVVTCDDLEVPLPMGLPAPVATRMFPIAQKTGLTSRKTVNSFDEVLRLTGNLDYNYLRRSVNQLVDFKRKEKPDLVYSEFNISAMIAAEVTGVKLCNAVSFPTQHEYANNPKLAGGLNKLLKELGLEQVESALKLFEMADVAVCPSIYELEPFAREGIVYCGTLKKTEPEEKTRDKILVYMGNGTVSAKRTLSVVKEAFGGSPYQVYLASSYLEKLDEGNIHVAPRWDFNELLDEAVLFINHGGQNSVVDGLIHGVPQICVPGKVFERKFNAASVEKNNAGVSLDYSKFNAEVIRTKADEILGSEAVRADARALGQKLLAAGGVKVIAESIRNIDFSSVSL